MKSFLKLSLKMKDRGIKPGLFFVLALSKRPGVLLEIGFMSNPKELRKISSPIFQEIIQTQLLKELNDTLV